MENDPILNNTQEVSKNNIDSSESEILQTASSNDSQKYYYLPKFVLPSKKAFESLGLTFEDFGNDFIYKTTLPENWKIKPGHLSSFIILDEKNRIRAEYLYFNNPSYDHMCLTRRFNILYSADYSRLITPIKVFVVDSNNGIIFTAGYCELAFSYEFFNLVEKAKNYLRSIYPYWNDPTKYWDD